MTMGQPFPSNALAAFLLLATAAHQLPKADAHDGHESHDAHLGALTFCDEENDIYCLNQSPCKSNWQDTPDSPCDCAKGYGGEFCEFHCTEADSNEPCDYSMTFDVCDLECENKGKCVQGASPDPSLGYIAIWAIEDMAMHCQCSSGFTGTLCEHEVEVCGGSEHVCLHGSKCNLEADGTFDCACPISWSRDLQLAGKFCQHHHTDICIPSGGVPEFSDGMALPVFCVNDGVCMDVVNEHQQVQSACICPPLYEGPHCEFLVSKLSVAGAGGSGTDSDGDGSDGISSQGFAALAVFIVGTMALAALFVARKVGKRLKREKEVPVNLQSFRDENRDENIGAMSPNGNSLFPSFSPDILEAAREHDAHLYDVEFC